MAKFQEPTSNPSHLKCGFLHFFFFFVFLFKAEKWCLAIVLKLFESKHVKNTNF